MRKFFIFTFSIIIMAFSTSTGNINRLQYDPYYLDKGESVILKQLSIDSLIAPTQMDMVVNHLYNIYQKPPPLEKTWPPANLKQWEKQRNYYKDFVREMLNIPSDKRYSNLTPEIRYTKPDLKRNDFTVKYLVYQSKPNFWVTSNLYIPNNATFPAPTIMVLTGHSYDTGKATEKYQVLIQNLLKKGYVVFSKDGIGLGERQYTNHNYGQKAPFTYMSGISVEGLETWDNILALNLLCSKEFSQWVDKERIGVIGHSGGAMQTAYLAILDERVKVAAASCQRNTYTAEFKLWGHCICCVCATNMRRKTEQYHQLATIAPRPMIITNGITDGNHPLEGAIHLAKEVKKVYSLYGKDANLELILDEVGHDFSANMRKAVYSSFNQHLKVNATDMEEPVVPLTPEEIYTGLPEESTAKVSTLVYRSSLELPHEKGVFNTRKKFERYRKSLVNTISNDIFGYAAYMPEKCDLEAKTVKRDDMGTYLKEIISYKSEPDISLNAILSYPKNKHNLPVIITIGSDDDVLNYLENDYAVLSIDLRPDGGNIKRYGDNWGVWARGMSCGKPSTGMRVYDILRSLDYLETRAGLIDKSRVGFIGKHTINAMFVLYAAALDKRIKSVVLVSPVTTYKPETEDISSWHQWGLDMYIPQILLHADVSQVASLFAPKPMLVVDGRDIGNKVLSPEEVKEKFSTCVHTYKLFKKEHNLNIQSSGTDSEYIKWFDKTLND